MAQEFSLSDTTGYANRAQVKRLVCAVRPEVGADPMTTLHLTNTRGPRLRQCILATKGSLCVTRSTLFDYYTDPAERAAGVARVGEMIRSGKVKVTIGQNYLLEQAAQAHRDLKSRATNGSTLLLP